MAKRNGATSSNHGQRRTQAERKANTQSRLLAVGREHFLRDGLTEASGEAIAEEAGFSRGALHSHFGDKEGLFLEVVREAAESSWDQFDKSQSTDLTPSTRYDNAQALFANLLEDPNFQLSVELQLQAIHNEKLRNGYKSLHRMRTAHAKERVQDLLAATSVTTTFTQEELITILMAASYGLAAMRRLLGRELSAHNARKMLASLFAILIPVD